MKVSINIVCKLCNHRHTNITVDPNEYLPRITHADCRECGVSMRMTITKKQNEIEVRSFQ